jgi:hypothetical protein
MHLFALDIEPWMIRWGFILLAGGIWLINRFFGDRDDKPARPAPNRRPRPPRREWVDAEEVDQALDDVLARPRHDIPPVPASGGPPEVVVLRAPQPQRRPQERPRQETRRTQKNRGTRGNTPPMARPVPSSLAPLVSNVAAETRQGLSDAVASMQSTASLASSAAPVATRRGAELATAGALHLTSPGDIRRAILLREILGPPLALRRERR